MPDLLVVPVTKPDENKLDDAYEVAADISTKVGPITVRVPKFFQYDGASVPAIAWQLIGTPFNPRFMLPAVFHDWLYHTQQVTRDQADELLHQLLIKNRIGKTKAWLMWKAVEAAGEAYWGNDPDDRAYLRRLAKRITADGRKPSDYGMQ